MNEWMAELFKTNSLMAQKNAEIRDLEETYRKLQKSPSLDKNESTSIPQGLKIAGEMQIKYIFPSFSLCIYIFNSIIVQETASHFCKYF